MKDRLSKHGKKTLDDSNIDGQGVHDDRLQLGANVFDSSPDDALQKVQQQLLEALSNVCIICFFSRATIKYLLIYFFYFSFFF